MSSYFFIIRNGAFENSDPDGTPLRDDRQAQIYALRIIRELTDGGGYEDGAWTITVFADDGREVCTVPFSLITGSARGKRDEKTEDLQRPS